MILLDLAKAAWVNLLLIRSESMLSSLRRDTADRIAAPGFGSTEGTKEQDSE